MDQFIGQLDILRPDCLQHRFMLVRQKIAVAGSFQTFELET